VTTNHMSARSFLAGEMRRAREAKGLSRAALGEQLYVSESLVFAWEKGRIVPRPEHLRSLVDVLDFDPGIVVRILEELVSGEVSPEWTGKWLSIEARADTLLSFEHSIVPGLAQTEDYARTVLRHDRHSPIDLEERLRSRLERQRILDREDDPPMIVFMLSEQALRLPVGGPQVMHDQLRHLIELADRRHVIVQAVPLDTGYHHGFAGAFMVARFDGTELAFQDGIVTGHVLEDLAEVSLLSRIWETIRSAALPQPESLNLIAKVAEQWKSCPGESRLAAAPTVKTV
jgi:transcriptional regulator with XRE-family HTH domain